MAFAFNPFTGNFDNVNTGNVTSSGTPSTGDFALWTNTNQIGAGTPHFNSIDGSVSGINSFLYSGFTSLGIDRKLYDVTGTQIGTWGSGVYDAMNLQGTVHIAGYGGTGIFAQSPAYWAEINNPYGVAANFVGLAAATFSDSSNNSQVQLCTGYGMFAQANGMQAFICDNNYGINVTFGGLRSGGNLYIEGGSTLEVNHLNLLSGQTLTVSGSLSFVSTQTFLDGDGFLAADIPDRELFNSAGNVAVFAWGTGPRFPTLGASQALATDASSFVVAATTTLAELNYVSGVTSAIQSQLNLKAASSTAVAYDGSSLLTAQTAAKTGATFFMPSSSTIYNIEFCAKVTAAGGVSSALGAGVNSGLILHYTDAADSVSQTLTVPLFDQAGNSVAPATGNTLNTTAAKLHGRCTINAKTGVAVTFDFGYTSSGTAMQYELNIVANKVKP